VICGNCSGTGIGLVQMRTRIMNQLQAVAMNEGLSLEEKTGSSQQGRALLEKLSLAPWASRRRKELLELLDQLIQKDCRVNSSGRAKAKKRPEVVQLMTHPGVDPSRDWLIVLVIGRRSGSLWQADRSYTGLIPCEDSSAADNGWTHQ